ncbi:type II toxin-antitoxin system RelE/ParE family toxin [Pseudaminobacter sp. 19-2017]|uniref:Type II toxin-antitoxin system RelE/ParE family toxin n=1 Tax=Pseudaminobacter soli (ex Zhang et al. 2022) TaxID=2831468 RepID=A0A942DVG9_9HYPH|nr:type II toxin-antitoxin system RelE/ParE family toxin [Pseudaminobacter soli]MBS3647032.1 type II toxin-antitoxin system RelE/ParE family toxin [Pseudaminobacter soli]
MTHTVLLSGAAWDDIAELLEFLVPRAGESVARAYVDRLIGFCEGFSLFPERGTRRDDISPGLRTVGYRRQATIAFRVEADRVIILRILYGGRDLSRLLDEE